MKTLQEISDYIWANQPLCRKWDKTKFEKWVTWHFSEGFICLVLDFDESIAGLAMIRPVLNPEDALDPMSFDHEGNCLYIAEAISTAKGALQALGFAVIKRFGQRELVCWQRPPDFLLETHKASALRRNLFRMEATCGTKFNA